MTPNPLQEKFDKARKDYAAARETKLLCFTLGVLRDACLLYTSLSLIHI